MSDRMTVTVSEDNKTIRVVVGNPLAIHREITIDATDAVSIVSGLVEFAKVGDQMVQAQLAQLAQKVEALEKSKGDKAAGAAS